MTSSLTTTAPPPDRFGLVGRPRQVLALYATVLCAALVLIAIGLLTPGAAPDGAPLSVLGGLGVAAAVVAGGQLARLRFRLGRGTVSVSWGEAAFIIGSALVPPGWLPLATFVGAAGAWLLISWLSDHRSIADIVHLAASLTVGAAGAAAVSTLVTSGARTGDTRHLVGLVAGACAYLVITLGLATLTLALHRDASAGQILSRALNAKIPMLVGNVLIALLGLWVLIREPLWLLAFPPALWLLQRTYRYHLVAEEERRVWAAFAKATAALPGVVEADVVRAGLRGAMDVFGARRVEIELRRPGGTMRRYYEDAPGQDVAASGLPGPVITRSMSVAGTAIGELTVWLSEPTLPVTRDELAVSAYGDALAGALHDAASHERLVELEARVARDDVLDQLTGLLNRSALLGDGDRALRAVARERHVALMLLDLRRFREVNDTLGHRSGDEVLTVIAERITDLARAGELVARIGDDEYALLMPAVLALTDSASRLQEAPNPLPQVVRRARDLADQLAQPMEVAGVRLSVEAAVGVVVSRAGMGDMAELIRRAGLALQHAKDLGVTVGTYDSARDLGSTDRLALLAELRDALQATDQIVLALQPAVDLETGAPTGVEALTRWKHPRRGQLPPGEFIPMIERSELLGEFTRYILDRSLASAAGWARAGFDLPVSVNISARSLLDPTLPAQVAEVLRRHHMPASQLVLEITESVAVSDQEIVDEVLAGLRETGVQLSVDDFGTGYSSLTFLTRVCVDELKVDRSFVDGMIDSPAAEAAVRGAVELGGRLNARVVAEGVETAEQRVALIELGCTVAQGYHFCKPLPADKIVYALRQLAEAAPAKIVPLRADDAS
ncbi:bifunctional diguanylate cyclase/phosphodiesterase [Actinoplanes sp. NBRC 103695]|uniref:putative bifunctional diguanylate cyclase/phosphodiesterase n=1 Tax=Actinoplanes sp. NBRC 103695 TaxID=3032202 RepID=UPI0025529D84|nr:bifunctional diguanylate cyclase/phosphodiesterase [Actinoplanes sp. NBRC 103695]